MAKRDKKEDDKHSDPRVEATSAIGGHLIAALAICIPLVVITKNPMIVLMVAGGAAVAISGIWYFGKSKEVETKSQRIEELESTIEDLTERLENVEVMNHYEEKLAERALEELEAEEQAQKPRSMGPTRE